METQGSLQRRVVPLIVQQLQVKYGVRPSRMAKPLWEEEQNTEQNEAPAPPPRLG